MRVESVIHPTNFTESSSFGLDLDGDDEIENRAGVAVGALYGQTGDLDLSAAAATRLANDVVWEIDVQECEGEDRFASRAQMPISTLWDPTARFEGAGWLYATHAAIDLLPLGDGRWEGRIAMGFVPADLIDAIAQPLAPYLDERELLMTIFDRAPKDGRMSVEELRDAHLTRSLFAPDVDTGGVLATSFGIGVTASELPAN